MRKNVEWNSFPGIEMTKTGNWLRYICKFKQVSVRSLCDYMRLASPQSVYGWFCGKTLPSLDNFYMLSQILHVPLDELIINKAEILPGRFCVREGGYNARLMMYRMKVPL